MVDRNIVNKLGISEQQLDQQVGEMFGEKENEFLEEVLRAKVDSHLPGTILKGRIVSQIGNDVIVEVGLKSEGVVEASEFADPEEITPGKEIEILLEETDSESGLILLSKHKADRIRGWENIINTKKEGDVVTGRVVHPHQRRFACGYQCARLPARLAGRYQKARRYQPLHRKGSRVCHPQD